MAYFNEDQAGLAFFLFVCLIFNIWFIFVSSQRAFRYGPFANKQTTFPYQLLSYSIFAMALFDVPWVLLCTIQCWNNMLTKDNSLHQDDGNDVFGCKLMGWYSSFSLVSMMGSHCLVAYYLLCFLESSRKPSNSVSNMDGAAPATRNKFLGSLNGFLSVTSLILIASVFFASFPLIEGGGYALTNGGFCYADFTNKTQSVFMLLITIFFLALSSFLWHQIGIKEYWYFYTIFFITWFLWIPACIYGIDKEKLIASPYFIIGALAGHGNAILNPALYGKHLYRRLDIDFPQEKTNEALIDVEESDDLVV